MNHRSCSLIKVKTTDSSRKRKRRRRNKEMTGKERKGVTKSKRRFFFSLERDQDQDQVQQQHQEKREEEILGKWVTQTRSVWSIGQRIWKSRQWLHDNCCFSLPLLFLCPVSYLSSLFVLLLLLSLFDSDQIHERERDRDTRRRQTITFSFPNGLLIGEWVSLDKRITREQEGVKVKRKEWECTKLRERERKKERSEGQYCLKGTFGGLKKQSWPTV